MEKIPPVTSRNIADGIRDHFAKRQQQQQQQLVSQKLRNLPARSNREFEDELLEEEEERQRFLERIHQLKQQIMSRDLTQQQKEQELEKQRQLYLIERSQQKKLEIQARLKRAKQRISVQEKPKTNPTDALQNHLNAFLAQKAKARARANSQAQENNEEGDNEKGDNEKGDKQEAKEEEGKGEAEAEGKGEGEADDLSDDIKFNKHKSRKPKDFNKLLSMWIDTEEN